MSKVSQWSRQLSCAVIAAVAVFFMSPVAPDLYKAEAAETKDPLPVLQIEDLGTPVRSARREGDFLVPKPNHGGWYFITSYGDRLQSPLQVYIVDLDTKKVIRKVFPQLTDWLARGLIGPDGKAYLNPYGQTGLLIFDPADASLEFVPNPSVKDRIQPHSMTLTSNGKIYMGTASGRAILLEFDPQTKTFRDFGVQGPPEPAPRYIWDLAVDDEYAYSGTGKNPWHLIATNRRTGEQRELLADKVKAIDYLTVGKQGEAIFARVTYNLGRSDQRIEYYRLAGGQAIPTDTEPQPTPQELERMRAERARKQAVTPELLLEQARPTSKGEAEIWYRLPGAANQKGPWQSVRLTGIQAWPWGIEAVGVIPGGRIMGVPKGYEDVFVYDPKTNRIDVPGKSPLSGYGVVTIDDTVYLLGYPGTIVFRYDPAKPWTYFTSTPEKKEPALSEAESNPQQIAGLGKIIKTHFPRGWAVGADGALYVGGHAERLDVGGGLAWWDPKTQAAGGLREPFELQDCDGLAAAQGGKTIVYSSRPVADPRGQLPTPEDARLFLFDVATQKLTGEITPIPKLTSCGRIAAIGDKVYGIAQAQDKQSVFYVVDVVTRKLVHSQPLKEGLHSTLEVGPDGQLYGIIGDQLTRFDPRSYQIKALGVVPVDGGQMVFLGNDIYLAGERNLRRIRNAPRL